MPPESNNIAESVRRPGIAAIVVVADGDGAALKTTLDGLAENSALPGLHVCVVAREPTTERARADFHQ